MSRIGMAPSRDAAKEAAGMASLPGIEIEGLFTHLQEQMRQTRPFTGSSMTNIWLF